MTESFTFAQTWKSFAALKDYQSEASTEGRASPQTPIHSQPACFRVGTPFPLAATPGGVRVAGKNATEIGFSFPPHNANGVTSFARRSNDPPVRFATKQWTHFHTDAVPSINARENTKATPRAQTPQPRATNRSALSPRRSLPKRPSVKSVMSDKERRESQKKSFRGSLESLSLDDLPTGRSISKEDDPKTTVAMVEFGQVQSEMEKLKRTVQQREGELLAAREEIQGLKENIRTLEFQKEEYAADDGCLGMYEFLKSWEEKVENGITDLKEKLQQEENRKAAYQNRYYAEVAKNAHLEERVDQLQTQLQERAQKNIIEASKKHVRELPKDTRSKKKVVARGGISKKTKVSARKPKRN